ncbi:MULTISPECIES: Rrf2 family transcriptional regulator [Lacticaseibacillus]|uniref:Rrf2 family transcriptional regulator n=2 Tax=Lacticaseibacillus TaxID=2759736 RepID=A0AAN1C6P0_LACCA|nr:MULTISPECIES: Rrf2 family transcriptional regulator [Lacticaseibacillus]ARY90713.1 Rrf2 family transcriptional regulator [Lacticaseibacillus casei]KAB1970570.1 Rrf2 family transcriptional regulator [Lacticaseibacillus casei]WLV81327.1 Rrf2 family transcriptional regulator [Lacticaseibacillus sp. NCIMB 15473]WNX25288.1 Rrf2 family transcriptional regulator [Lacticaseibacillus casei]WNX28058.1 Rrf2 family transcriptional regulator [Lacticaseibacillus casei]
MKISSSWEQSIYVLLILSRLPKGKSVNSLALSERLNVSHSYLKKTIKSLVKEGFVKSIPGKSGGFSLAMPLNEIDFYKVFQAVEGRGKVFASQHLLAEFLDKDQSEIEPCAVSAAMDNIENSLKKTMQAITLDQMVKEIQEKYDTSDLDQWLKQVAH